MADEKESLTGSERELLHQMIRTQSDAVIWKLEGLTDEQAKRSVVGSATTLLGIAQHLQFVERWWLRIVIDEEDVAVPWSKDDPDADWRVTDDDTIEAVVAAYRAEIEITDAIIEKQKDLGRVIDTRHRILSVRWILMHLVEEHARHAGHADIIREVIDGETGYLPS